MACPAEKHHEVDLSPKKNDTLVEGYMEHVSKLGSSKIPKQFLLHFARRARDFRTVPV